jgi:membrane protein YdbS with pleckstrin-like domain
VLISSINESYIAMINSTDKISARVSCSIVVVFIVFSQVDVIELRHKLVWLFDVSG